MQRAYAKELSGLSGKKAEVQGWVHEIRDIGGLKFIVLKDKTGFMQLTLPKKAVSPAVFEKAASLTKESIVSASGLVKNSPQAQNGVELIPDELEIVSLAKAPVPIDMSGKINSDLSVRLDYRFLDLRNPKSIALFRIRSKVSKFIAEFFDYQGFMNINTPKLTVAGVESGAELFPVVYFDRQAFLSQSPQIYKQMMVAAGFEKVYELGVVFRAEKSNTTRHLTEFTGVDFEQGFIESEHDAMDTAEGLMKHIIKRLTEECPEELKLWGRELKPADYKFPRMTMKEVKEILAKKGKILPPEDDLDPEAEKMLGEIVKEKFGSEFVFVTEYPWSKRPFYHMKPEGKSNLTKSFDLIWNGVEIATGAQREHRYEILKAQAKEKGLNLDEMKDYAMIFQYGCPPHGGAGLGLDRMIECLMKLDNIREGILLPRDPVRLTP